MKHISVLFSLFLIVVNIAVTQSIVLPMPTEIREAYKTKTRSGDGMPGINYFQNSARYKLNIDFEPKTGQLEGNQKVTYFNNSPDTLYQLIIRLYPNLYKQGEVRLKQLEAVDIHHGIDIKKVIVQGNARKLYFSNQLGHTIGGVDLYKPLMPGDSAVLQIDWTYRVNRETQMRNGMYHGENYFISYFYPQIAVYDDIWGWDILPFSGLQEFYNDYNQFDLTVKCPVNYMVHATGTLENAVEIFSDEILQKIEQSKASDENVLIADFTTNNFSCIKRGRLSWHYKANNVSDIALSLTHNYKWEAASVVVDSASNQRVWVNTLYSSEAEEFEPALQAGRMSLALLHQRVGLAYPYHKMIIFEGGPGGMEYPMLINNQDMSDYQGTVMLVAHEIAHTYFPFLTGLNERKYAWMDEGLVTYLPKSIEQTITSISPIPKMLNDYLAGAGTEHDQPLMVRSDQLNGYSYYFNAYRRSSVMFYLLEDYLGSKTFKACIMQFIQRWRGKHPTPFDFINTITDVTGNNLNWFWYPWLYEFKYTDVALTGITKNNEDVVIKCLNEGGLPVPLKLSVEYVNNETSIIEYPMDIWKEQNRQVDLQFTPQATVKAIQLITSAIPDVNINNNRITMP